MYRSSAKGFQVGVDSSRRGDPEARRRGCGGGTGNTVAPGELMGDYSPRALFNGSAGVAVDCVHVNTGPFKLWTNRTCQR